MEALAKRVSIMPETVDIVLSCFRTPGVIEEDKDNNFYINIIKSRFSGFDFRTFIYDKSKKHGDESAIRLPNVGREQHTFAHHTCENYDDLGDYVIYVASSRPRHPNRAKFLKSIKQSKDCELIMRKLGSTKMVDNIKATKLREIENFRHAKYLGRKLQLADPRPLKKWALFHIGRWDSRLLVGHEGVFKTTGELIRKTPLSVYEQIREEGSFADSTEFAHYMERLPMLVYGNPY